MPPKLSTYERKKQEEIQQLLYKTRIPSDIVYDITRSFIDPREQACEAVTGGGSQCSRRFQFQVVTPANERDVMTETIDCQKYCVQHCRQWIKQIILPRELRISNPQFYKKGPTSIPLENRYLPGEFGRGEWMLAAWFGTYSYESDDGSFDVDEDEYDDDDALEAAEDDAQARSNAQDATVVRMDTIPFDQADICSLLQQAVDQETRLTLRISYTYPPSVSKHLQDFSNTLREVYGSDWKQIERKIVASLSLFPAPSALFSTKLDESGIVLTMVIRPVVV
jgi:hypothetical protein